MKIKSLLLAGAVGALAFTTTAKADLEVVIAGATAFRAASHAAISSYLGASVRVVHTGTSLSGASAATFSGTHAGIAGTITIRTAWNGSVEGVKAAAEGLPVDTIPTSQLPVSGTATGGTATEEKTATMGFSDSFKESTGIAVGEDFSGADVNDIQVGVIPFLWVANEGAPFTNITDSQIKTILTNGFVKAQLFTGAFGGINARNVYAVGRNRDSGTRIAALANGGVGLSSSIKQYRAVDNGSSWATISALNYAGDDQKTNGETSGGTVSNFLRATSASVSVNGGSAVAIHLVGYVGVSDANSAIANGAVGLSYNGVPFSNDAVKNGSYTFWSYEHFFHNNTLTDDEQTFVDAFVLAIPANIGSAGIKLDEMNAFRAGDGELISI